ncbi:MAG: hypothetical protein ACO3PV_01715 [Pseudohongiellaceae bacterium]
MLELVPLPAFSDNYIWLFRAPGSAQAGVVDPGDAGPVLRYLQQHRCEGPPGPVTLLLERELQPEQLQDLQQYLERPLELLSPEGYGSLALQGLAELEALR